MEHGPSFHPIDLTEIRLEQARLLKENARQSALIVFFLVANTSAILALMGVVWETLIWFIAANVMILVTVIYAHPNVTGEVSRANVHRYLHWHTIISGLTGLLWGAFAIFASDNSLGGILFVLSLLLVSITLGGLLPGSIYRPGYVALAAGAILPFATYLLFFAMMPVQLIGFGFYGYFAVAMLASVNNEVNIRDSISSRLSRDASEEIARKNVEIEALMADKARFVAAISHDLSQPLGAQRHFLAQLAQTPMTKSQRALLQKFQAAQHNQERLLQDLVEANVGEPDWQPELRLMTLDEALDRVMQEFDGVAWGSELTLVQDIPALEVYTDPKLLSRVVRNLLSNAIKFTDPGGTVRARARIHDGRVCLEIQDEGIGIPRAQLDRVFDEYVRLNGGATEDDNGRPQAGGLGLGLSIVKKLSDQLNIDVSLTSVVGEGTCFSLLLPEIPAEASELTSDAATALAGRFVMLMAEPRDPKGDDLADQLSRAGHRVLHATSRAEAVELLGQIADIPDVVLCAALVQPPTARLAVITAIREEVNEDIPALLVGAPHAEEDWPLPNLTVMGEEPIADVLKAVARLG